MIDRVQITLNNLLLIENDPAILEFRCQHTGLPVWPQIRISLFRMILSDFFYDSAPAGGPAVRASPIRAMSTMCKSIIRNTWFRASRQSGAAVCFFSVGVANQLVDGKWFNRLSDHFSISCPTETLTVEDHFEWAWPFPRHNRRVISHGPQQLNNAVVARLCVREEHRQQAGKLIDILSERSRRHLSWTLSPARKAWLINTLAGRTAAMPRQFQSYRRLLLRVRPKLLMIEGACYGGPLATLSLPPVAWALSPPNFSTGRCPSDTTLTTLRLLSWRAEYFSKLSLIIFLAMANGGTIKSMLPCTSWR